MTAATVGDILARLDGVKATGAGKWKALCPVHDDSNPSLSIAECDGGKPLLHCFAGCAYPDIMTAIGLSVNGNGANSSATTQVKTKAHPARRTVATYDYHDAAGRVVFQKMRYEPKSFTIRRPDGRGGYVWNLGDIEPVLYHLPALLDLQLDWQPVYICEGEKDVDRLTGLGFVATCNFDGAAAAGQRSKWREAYDLYFTGRVVYIMADNDDAGRAHAAAVANGISGNAQAVKVVYLPDLPDKGDVSDWLDAGHTKEELERECLMSPLWEPLESAAVDLLDTSGDGAAGAFRMDDTGNSERFTAQHSDNVRFNHSTGDWYIWTGTHLRRDDDGGIQRLAKVTVRGIYEEAAAAAKAGGDELAAQLSKWARASAAESRRNAMLNLARAEYPIALTHDRLNTHDLLLNCRNGTLDLASGLLSAHDRGDRLTYVLPVDYDPAAVAPTWDAFIRRIMNNDGDMIRFLAAAVGYTLSGQTAAQVLFFLYGRGANGKSTFIEAVLALMGDLGHKARAQVLMQDERGRVPNEIAALAGKRLVVASELADGGRLNEGMVKDLTGSDSMSARFLYGEPFTFKPTFKLWLYGNHKPVITGTDDGIWRRVRLIPFTVQIPDDERDPNLPAKLRAELPGILAWAVRGWMDYRAHGLGTPAAVATATAEYRSESDIIGTFINERCYLNPNATARAGDLYDMYSEWAKANNLKHISGVRFSKTLKERDFKSGRDKRGNFWQGVGIQADIENE